MLRYFPLKLKYFLRNNINEIYLLHALRTFALSTIAVFIPIFLLKEGFPLELVIGYLLLQHVFILSTVKYFIRFAAQKGVKRSIVISSPLLMISFALLYKLSWLRLLVGDVVALAIVGFGFALSGMFYYMGFHIDFSKSHQNKKSAKQVSIVQTLSIVLSILGPLLGAIIITSTSFQVLFVVVICIIALSLLPLFFSKEVREEKTFFPKQVWTKRTFNDSVAYLGEGLRDPAAGTYWPILLFLLAVNLKEIGGLYTLTNALLAVLTLFLGRVITPANSMRFLTWGANLHALSLSIRVLFTKLGPIAFAQSLGALSWGLVHVPYFSTHYNKSKKLGVAQVTYAREVYLALGRIMSLGLLIIALMIGLPNIPALIAFIFLGAIGTLFMQLLKEKKSMFYDKKKKKKQKRSKKK